MSKQEIFNLLAENGCCDTCRLRYFKARGDEYEDIKDSFTKLGIDCNLLNDEEICNKRSKLNTCTTCLNFFSDDLQENIIKTICEHEDIKKYDCPNLVLTISLPISINIREISMWYALVKKFGMMKFNSEKPPDVSVKEAGKLLLAKRICDKLDKDYDANGISVNIFFNYKDDKEEIGTFSESDAAINKLKILNNPSNNSNRKPHKREITRNYLEKIYLPSKITTEIYGKYFDTPPKVPTCSLYLEKISFTGPTVFVAGRYRKLTRELSHSPWILQGRRVMENSIEEFIVRSVAPHFGVNSNNVIFSSSGREDVDVRCLGKGRPFVLEIFDSTRTILPNELAARIELDIEKCEQISVHNLQIVQREDVTNLKAGEEAKKKIYRALCALKEPATIDVLEKLNISEPFVIEQVTPIRVLHRRPLHTRPRTVFSIKPYVDKNNKKILILDIVTQAGTYIKELVHGEFGRTKPSLSSIIGQWIDIIALDVTGIDLDWPKDINNRKYLKQNSVNIDKNGVSR